MLKDWQARGGEAMSRWQILRRLKIKMPAEEKLSTGMEWTARWLCHRSEVNFGATFRYNVSPGFARRAGAISSPARGTRKES